ncbi:hypothetical protein SLA2020_218880 [Shorea laevis]
MRTGEERAAWQCNLVKVDASRGPKSSGPSSSSKLYSYGKHGNAANGPDEASSIGNFDNQNHELPPESKGLVHMQHNTRSEKNCMVAEQKALEADELEVSDTVFVNRSPKISDDYCPDKTSCIKNNVNSFKHCSWNASAACVKNDLDARIEESKAILVSSALDTSNKSKRGKFWDDDEHLMVLEFDYLAFQQPNELSCDFESQWVEVKKTEPWWRTADKGELASLIALKSHEYIENCDLPQPQSKQFGKEQFGSTESFFHSAGMGLSNLTDHTLVRSVAIGAAETRCTLDHENHSLQNKDRLLVSGSEDSNTINSSHMEMEGVARSDPSKDQVMGTLCHCKTRAREAEEAAEKARAESDHIVKLFFQQASHLFAYKQWLQLLQLENICLQLKNKKQPISILFPAGFPLVLNKCSQVKKSQQKPGKRTPKYEIGKCSVAFVVGLSLAGAGLLLGWTLGWLSPFA